MSRSKNNPPPGEQLLARQGRLAVPRELHPQQAAQPRPDVRPLTRIRDEPIQPGGQLASGHIRGIFLGDRKPLAGDLG